MNFFLLVFTMLVLSSIPAFSTSIEVSGNISSNTTWDVDTVFVVGDVTVADSYTLTIQPGVKVIANGFYKLSIQGTILAEGTETDSILFTAADHETGWNRIFFDSTPASNDTSKFSYCIVEYGKPFYSGEITLYRNGGAFFVYYVNKFKISNSTIRNNEGVNTSLYFENSSAAIENCDIYSNSNYGISSLGSSTVCKIYNNKIHDNLGGGIYPGYSSNNDVVGNLIYNNGGWGIACWESVSRITNNTIVGNNLGGVFFGGGSNNDLYNNIIYGNSVTQVSLNIDSDPNFYYCNIEGGSAGFTGDGAGAEYTGTYSNCIDLDPGFAGEGEHPYAIVQFSYCQDRGYAHAPELTGVNEDIAGNQRISNGFIDIGAYEYYIRTDTVSGVWTLANSPYMITGNQYIADGTTLTIEPGVEVIFQDFFSFTVDGTIIAEGTKEDSILFTAANTDVGWNRFVFRYVSESNDTSKFAYCVVEYGKPTSSNSYSNNRDGGAFYLYEVSKLNISHCDIRYSQGTNAIIYIECCKANISDCKIYNNSHYAILVSASTDSSRICNNEIFNNSSSGIYSGYHTNSEIIGNVIHNNGGWGVYSYRGYSTYINNTITDNTSGGINFRSTSVNDLYNNIIYGNSVTQVQLEETCDPNFYYCDIEGGVEGFAGAGAGDNYSGLYENCIDSDPVFVDTLNFNYTLLEGSPCLDAGTPDVTGLNLPPTDAAGNARIINGRIDIGSYEGPHPPVSVEDAPTNIIKSFTLSQNYPNPFNPVTTIHYELPNAAHVTIEVFNVMGQKVQTLINEQKSAGKYNLLLNGKNLSSGIYFYHIKAGSFVDVKKMVLLK